MILDRKVWPRKLLIERNFGRKPPPRGQRSKSECASLTSSFDRSEIELVLLAFS